MPLAWGANFLEILAERYSHPPERKFGTVPHQLKMTNSPPTCKIAIFRRRSAAAETKDTQSEPFRERRVTSIDGVSLTSRSPTRPTSSLNPSHLRTDALLEPRSASITSIPTFCVQARGRAVEACTAITGFADWSQFWLGVDRRM
jgi:hypothetical protein